MNLPVLEIVLLPSSPSEVRSRHDASTIIKAAALPSAFADWLLVQKISGDDDLVPTQTEAVKLPNCPVAQTKLLGELYPCLVDQLQQPTDANVPYTVPVTRESAFPQEAEHPSDVGALNSGGKRLAAEQPNSGTNGVSYLEACLKVDWATFSDAELLPSLIFQMPSSEESSVALSPMDDSSNSCPVSQLSSSARPPVSQLSANVLKADTFRLTSKPLLQFTRTQIPADRPRAFHSVAFLEANAVVPKPAETGCEGEFLPLISLSQLVSKFPGEITVVVDAQPSDERTSTFDHLAPRPKTTFHPGVAEDKVESQFLRPSVVTQVSAPKPTSQLATWPGSSWRQEDIGKSQFNAENFPEPVSASRLLSTDVIPLMAKNPANSAEPNSAEDLAEKVGHRQVASRPSHVSNRSMVAVEGQIQPGRCQKGDALLTNGRPNHPANQHVSLGTPNDRKTQTEGIFVESEAARVGDDVESIKHSGQAAELPSLHLLEQDQAHFISDTRQHRSEALGGLIVQKLFRPLQSKLSSIKGDTRMTMHMKLPELGRIDVEFKLAGDKLRALFTVESTAVKQALEAELTRYSGDWKIDSYCVQTHGGQTSQFGHNGYRLSSLLWDEARHRSNWQPRSWGIEDEPAASVANKQSQLHVWGVDLYA